MNRPEYRIPSEYRIPENQAQDVFTRAAQLYAEHNQSYSVKELMEAGTEARIPPEFIQQAIEELQIQQSPAHQPVPPSQTKKLVVGLAIALPLLAAIAGIGWLLARNAATNAQQQPVQTEQPIAVQPPVAQPALRAGERPLRPAEDPPARPEAHARVGSRCIGDTDQGRHRTARPLAPGVHDAHLPAPAPRHERRLMHL